MMSEVATKKAVLLHGVFGSQLFDWLSEKGVKEVYFMEGRPALNAARSTAKELLRRKIKPVLIADNMAGFLFYKGLVKEVVVPHYVHDRNGAIAPIGSLILGVLARRHKVRLTTFPGEGPTDLLGKDNDLLTFNGSRVAAKNIKAFVPLVEWLPKKYITKLVK